MLGSPSHPRRITLWFLALLVIFALILGACATPPATSLSTAGMQQAAAVGGAPAPPPGGAAFPSSAPVAEAAPLADTRAVTHTDDAFAAAAQPTPLILPTTTPAAGTGYAPGYLPPSLAADGSAPGPIRVLFAENVPAFAYNAFRPAMDATSTLEVDGGEQPLSLARSEGEANAYVSIGYPGFFDRPGYTIYEDYFAVVAPFDTVQDDITLDEIIARLERGSTVYTTDVRLNYMPFLLSQASSSSTAMPLPTPVKGEDRLIDLLEQDRDAIAIVSFPYIDPRFKVLTVNGVNLLSNHLQEDEYPLVYQIKAFGAGAPQLAALLRTSMAFGETIDPSKSVTNRDPSKLTTLIMTGVTAMARGTAAAIERAGDPAYPARIIGPTLAEADITHVSNEIPFIKGCEVNNTENNLQLCSDPSYWAALELMGTDIVGLSGNHVNDFGRDGARESLGWYKENKIPVYGSGLTVDSACAPLLWEHNGNTFAFIAALAYGPESAWVTDEEPGSCYYYDHKDRIISTIQTLSKAVDIVAVELQYEETYFPYPTPSQVDEFRELRAAGADLVTGVQSHVPQAQEPYGIYDEGGDGFISYGLGNLYFDQMWSWETRTELYARHTIYDGKLINTEILTGVLEDYAQPRWATPEERADLLQTIFDAAPARP